MKWLIPLVLLSTLPLFAAAETESEKDLSRSLAVVYAPLPDYPEALRVAGIEGTVVVEAVVSEEGLVIIADVLQSDHEAFSEVILEAIQDWTFKPALDAEGKAKVTVVRVPIRFDLKRPQPQWQGPEIASRL